MQDNNIVVIRSLHLALCLSEITSEPMLHMTFDMEVAHLQTLCETFLSLRNCKGSNSIEL
jgi:hypothetical protein